MNTCLLREILKKFYWEHVEFDEVKSQFLTFLVVYHILSKTENWPFLRLLLRMNSSEMQCRSTQNEKNWIGCYYRLIDMSMVRVLRVSTFATELNLARWKSAVSCYNLRYTCRTDTDSCYYNLKTYSTKPVISSILHLRPCMDDLSTALILWPCQVIKMKCLKILFCSLYF